MGSNISNVMDKAPTDLFGALGDSIVESIKGFVDKVTPKEKRYAPFLQFADTVVLPASGFAVLSLKGPTRGRFWYIRKLRVSGQSPTAVVSSSSEITFSGGAAPIVTVPAGATWNLQSISFIYTTDGVGGNRTIQITIRDATNRILYQATSPFNQPIATATEYSLAPGLTASANGAPVSVTMPLPSNLSLTAGATISVTAQGSDPGDTTTNGAIIVSGTTRADIFISPDDLRSTTTLAQCPITTWRDQLVNIPQVQSYGVGELRVGAQEVVSVAISGVAGTAYVASLETYEWPDIDENVEWVM